MSKPTIPSSWAFTKLGKVTEYGRVNKAEPNEIEDSAWVLELEDIEKNTSKLLARVSFADRQSKSTKNRFEPGDVLYGKLCLTLATAPWKSSPSKLGNTSIIVIFFTGLNIRRFLAMLKLRLSSRPTPCKTCNGVPVCTCYGRV